MRILGCGFEDFGCRLAVGKSGVEQKMHPEPTCETLPLYRLDSHKPQDAKRLGIFLRPEICDLGCWTLEVGCGM